MYDLGLSTSLHLVDVVSIDDPTVLGDIPRPALALLLVLPTCDNYEQHRRATDSLAEASERSILEDIVWFRQTINNACGLYAILHATCNFAIKDHIRMSSSGPK